ncbi:MAG: polysaccharide biosynthesis/export family protein [Kiritimatiellia bacterium]|nr:polysaccharide biosynthesis/export family protein [Kiritimatiellia bacterium]
MTNNRTLCAARVLSVAAATAVLSGCATRPPYAGNLPDASSPGSSSHSVGFIDGAQASFSDEVSRDLVRQTRKLIELKARDYLVGSDDVLDISIFEWEMSEETKTLDFRVAESGVISLPVIGVLGVAGKTVQEIHKTIESELRERGVFQNPRVSVSVKEFRSQRIAVIGAVTLPGDYAIHQNVSTLMDMLTMAGGPDAGAGQRIYVLRQGEGSTDPLRIVVDMEELFDQGAFEMNPVLQGGDIVYVPRAPLVYVYGNVRQPGGFALRRSMRIVEALALAGGLAPNADRRNCFLVRRKQGSPSAEKVVHVDVRAIERGKAPNFFLSEGDVLHVPESSTRMVFSELWNAVRGIFTFTYRLDSSG